MATAYVSFGRAGAKGSFEIVDIRNGNPTSTETVTTSASSAQSVGTAPSNGFVSIFCASDLYARVGINPTAAPTTSWFVPNGSTFEIGVKAGEKVFWDRVDLGGLGHVVTP